MGNDILEYTDVRGRCPYREWIEKLKDGRARARILMRIDRMELGLFGDAKSLGDGVSELRVSCGPGYRVYYAQDGDKVFLLLCGGDKSQQSKDIERAKAFSRQTH